MRCFGPVFLLALATSGAANAQTNVFDMLKSLAKASAKPGAAVAPTGAPSALAAMSEAQRKTIDGLVMARQPNPEIERNVREANSLISRLVSTGACSISDTAWNAFNLERVAPHNWDRAGLYSIVAKGRHHDKRYCYDVVKFGDFSKPAGNALTFHVFYVSPHSQEAGRQSFEIQKSVDGQWLLREVGIAFN